MSRSRTSSTLPSRASSARSPPRRSEALLEELAITSRLIREHVGGDCVGLRTPFGYYRGLRDRPDLLEIVRTTGLRYVTSWGRNEENANPTPWVQPFTYEEEGYPDILELPFQFWLDVVWFDQHGYDSGPALLEALKGAVDEVAEHDLVYGACFHDWVMLASDERRVGWLRGFLRYAQQRGVEVTTYTEYWRSGDRAPSARRSGIRTCGSPIARIPKVAASRPTLAFPRAAPPTVAVLQPQRAKGCSRASVAVADDRSVRKPFRCAGSAGRGWARRERTRARRRCSCRGSAARRARSSRPRRSAG